MKHKPSIKLINFNLQAGKIQGGSRKFLDSFKSYFGPQISSQSLNEIHIGRLQPKSATKGDLKKYIFVFDSVFRVGVTDCKWRTQPTQPNAADEVRILAVIGRYGSHLMIVMIFVAQNNF